MFTTCRVWTVVLLGFCFTDGSWGFLPAYTTVNCTKPTSFDYGSTNEGYSGTMEYIDTPLQVNLALESESCLTCLSFLDLSHTPEDAYATVNTKIPLDAEALTEYHEYINYTVVCMDSGVRNSRTVKLKDINDNAPVFEKDVYKVQVSESLPEKSLVVQVKATDADLSPVYNTVTYSIEPESDTFEVTSDGSVLLMKQLNYAVASLYSFNVKAMDIDKLSGTTTVEVTVTSEGGGTTTAEVTVTGGGGGTTTAEVTGGGGGTTTAEVTGGGGGATTAEVTVTGGGGGVTTAEVTVTGGCGGATTAEVTVTAGGGGVTTAEVTVTAGGGGATTAEVTVTAGGGGGEVTPPGSRAGPPLAPALSLALMMPIIVILSV